MEFLTAIGAAIGIISNGVPLYKEWRDERYYAPIIRALDHYLLCADGKPGDECRSNLKTLANEEAAKLDIPDKWVLDHVWFAQTKYDRARAVYLVKVHYTH